MRIRRLNVLLAIVAFAAVACGETITGTILIKKRLTRPSVTPAVSVYQRGPAVKLGTDAEQDPIAYERSRVVLYLEGTDLATAHRPKPDSTEIQQIDRRFLPDLVVVPVGSTVSFPNMDPIFHNIFSLSKPKTFDLGSYDKGETRRVQFPRAGIVEVYCHLHPNMEATIVVAPNRWYARPDRSGRYRVDDVPPGHYTLVAWHKTAGYFKQPIVIEAGQDSVADFLIPIDMAPKQVPR